MPLLRDGELFLYGFVGDSFWDEGFTASQVLDALAEHGRDNDIAVHINSGGGYVHEGVAIYNALKTHRGKVTVFVDSVAASSASVIAMGGDEIVMRAGALMMIHDPSQITWGDVEEHQKSINALDRHGASIAAIYAERVNGQASDLRDLMKAEHWMTADEAVEQKFADRAETSTALNAAAFDFRVFARAPEALRAESGRKNWSLAGALTLRAASAARATAHKENSMSDQSQADAQSAALTTARAEAVAAYKQRITDVKALAEYEGREALADTLIETDLTVDQIKASLAKAEKKTAAQPADPAQDYAARRAAAGSGLAAIGGADPKASKVERIMTNYRALTGAPAKRA